jgi:hypothetical protein
MAPEKNLVLYDCIFEDIQFEQKFSDSFKIYQHFQDLMMDKLFDIALYSTVISFLGAPSIFQDDKKNPDKRYADKFLEEESVKGSMCKKMIIL